MDGKHSLAGDYAAWYPKGPERQVCPFLRWGRDAVRGGRKQDTLGPREPM